MPTLTFQVAFLLSNSKFHFLTVTSFLKASIKFVFNTSAQICGPKDAQPPHLPPLTQRHGGAGCGKKLLSFSGPAHPM